MKRIAIVAAAMAVLSACSSKQPPRIEPPLPVAPQPARPRADNADNADRCGAKDLAYLVGRPKGEIPVPVDPTRRRVTCTTCPATMDYSPMRLNILFDAETGVIKQVKCG